MDVNRPLRRPMAGVTLLELLTTSTVALTLTAVAIPAAHEFITLQETSAATNQVTASLALARQAAVTRGQRVVMCPSVDSEQCSGGFDWSDGWLVFSDDDEDYRRDPDEELLAVTVQPAQRVRILTSTGRRRIAYRADGGTAGTNVTFRICNARDPDRRRSVIVNVSGRSKLGRRDAQGRPISCD